MCGFPSCLEQWSFFDMTLVFGIVMSGLSRRKNWGMNGWEARAWGLYIWKWSCQAQMPVPGTMVVPWHPVLWLCLEIGIGHAEAIRAKLQQGLYILIDLTNSKGTWAGRPKRRGLHLARELPRRTSCSLLWMFLMASFRYRTRLLPWMWRSRLAHRRWWVKLAPQRYGDGESAGVLITCHLVQTS